MAVDPQRHYATVNCRTAKGSFDRFVGAANERDRNGEAERRIVFAFTNGRVISGSDHSYNLHAWGAIWS